MFDSSYKFRYVNSNDIIQGQFNVIKHKLTFSCRHNQKYIVEVDQFEYHVYIIKFYLKKHRLAKEKRFKFKTNMNIPSSILGTCFEILLYFYKEDPYASFGFVGENSLDEPSKINTKRFRVYSKLVQNLVSPIDFVHTSYVDKSAFLLLNKHNTEPDLLQKIEKIFNTMI